MPSVIPVCVVAALRSDADAVGDAAWWAEQIGADFPLGVFGEDLRVEGLEAVSP